MPRGRLLAGHPEPPAGLRGPGSSGGAALAAARGASGASARPRLSARRPSAAATARRGSAGRRAERRLDERQQRRGRRRWRGAPARGRARPRRPASPACARPRFRSETAVCATTSSIADLLQLGLVGRAHLLLGGLARGRRRRALLGCVLMRAPPVRRCSWSRAPRQRRPLEDPPWSSAGAGAARRCGREARRRCPSSPRTGAVHAAGARRSRPRGTRSPRSRSIMCPSMAVADRAPEVLLDQAARRVGERHALVQVARPPARRRPRSAPPAPRTPPPSTARHRSAPRRSRSGVRPHRPPDLRVLDDRARVEQELDVLSVRRPAAVGVGNAAAREALGEGLGAHRVQPRVPAVKERRVGANGEQQRQHRAQAVADPHRAVGAAHADVHVQGERVVAPSDVVEALVDPSVVLGVDDVLLAVVGPRMRAGGAERDAARRRRARTGAGGGRAGGRGVVQVLTPPGADLDLGRDQLAGDRIGEDGVVSAAASRSSSKRGTRSSVRGSRTANSSSRPTVRSVDAANSSSACRGRWA